MSKKNIGSKKIWVQKNVGQKKCCVGKVFGSRNLGQQNLVQTFLGPNDFRIKKNQS